ncbi:MAG: hypothetical protein ACI37Q_03655 [Candidatus Gastranaerophilaceae bacterium]
MTTSVSSVNAGATAASESSVKKSSLSDSTKSKLAQLGIEETQGMTESEAQSKIRKAEREKQAREQREDYDNASEGEIRTEAKSLATAVGVSLSDDDDISEMLNAIGDKLESQLEEAENNPAVLSQLSVYLSKLKSLDNRYDSISNMYSAMNMISTNNKIMHGLD